jgi:hypothetical protein
MKIQPMWRLGLKIGTGGLGSVTNRDEESYRPGKKLVLTAGLLYLGVIAFGMFAQMTRMGLIESGNALATVDKIIASSGMLQVAFASDILGYTCFILLGLTCYHIFMKINNKVALVMLVFVIVSGSYAIINMINVLDAIQIVSSVGPLTGNEADMVLMHLNVHSDGSIIAQIIGWGPWLIPLGYIGYKSGFVPKAIGVILTIGGIGLTAQGFQYFLMPGMDAIFTPAVVASIIGEFSICGWFLYRGMKGFEVTSKEMRSDPCGADTNM